MPDSVAPSPWSSTWKQARAESEQRRALEGRFAWMTEADLSMITMGLEPYPWEEFAEVISRTQEWKFQAIEQRACYEEVHQTGGPSGPNSLVGAGNNNNNIYAGGPRRVPPATSDSTP
jgi:hypothetical protein